MRIVENGVAAAKDMLAGGRNLADEVGSRALFKDPLSLELRQRIIQSEHPDVARAIIEHSRKVFEEARYVEYVRRQDMLADASLRRFVYKSLIIPHLLAIEYLQASIKYLMTGRWVSPFEILFAKDDSTDTSPKVKTGYETDRGIKKANYYTGMTPLGYVEETVRQMAEKFGDVRYLGIGIGKGILEQELKTRFGGRLEVSAFSFRPLSSEGCDTRYVDKELPPGDVAASSLGRNQYHLILSVYGSFYAGYEHDLPVRKADYAATQITVIQKVYDALVEGGEAFVMVDLRSPEMKTILDLIRGNPHVFRARGVDIVAMPDHDISLEAYLWIRKIGSGADIEVLIEAARALSAGAMEKYILPEGAPVDHSPVFRTERDGEWLQWERLDFEVRKCIVGLISQYGLDAVSMAKIITGRTPDGAGSAIDLLAAEIMKGEFLSDIKGGMPVKTLIRHFILPASPAYKAPYQPPFDPFSGPMTGAPSTLTKGPSTRVTF